VRSGYTVLGSDSNKWIKNYTEEYKDCKLNQDTLITKRAHLFALQPDSSKMKLSEITDVQDHWLNTDYYATLTLKTTQDGKKCEATE
jgi:hypothetical protein